MEHTKPMADRKVKLLAVFLLRRVCEDDYFGAKSLLSGIGKRDRKRILSTMVVDKVPLSGAAMCKKKNLVELLAWNNQAKIEEDKDFISGTPLWFAARYGRLDVVRLLQKFGADINATSNDGSTPVSVACSSSTIRSCTAEYLIRQGADIHRPDDRGETCLMKSVHHLKLCKLLVEKGARVNEQDILGNTALHHAVTRGNRKTVHLLLDHGSNQNIKNNLGDDVLQWASLHRNGIIIMKLVARQEPTPSRMIESQQLLGSHCLLLSVPGRVSLALVYWRGSVALRINEREPLPVCMSTLYEELCDDEEMMHMYALKKMLRILSPGHNKTMAGLVRVCEVFSKNGKYRRSFDLLRSSFQILQQAHTQTWIDDYLSQLRYLNRMCADVLHRSQYGIEFHDVFEILDTVSSNAQFVRQMNKYDKSRGLEPIFSLVQFVLKLDKSPDQMDSFKQIIRRLVRSEMRNCFGKTFLHHAVELCCSFRGCLSVVELFLECGADVNAVDRNNNTALHLCTQPHLNFAFGTEREEVINLLLRYSAHVDMVNDSGHIAAKGLQLQILDHVNLQCLAATFIRDRRIPYVGGIPAHLEPFVQMHGRHP